MDEISVKRMILVSALEAEMQGMIADNKDREQRGLSMAYEGVSFGDIAERMQEIATMNDEQIMEINQ